MEYLTSEETVKKSIEDDLKYIQEDKIAHQANGGYCKISNILKCITVENMTKSSYMNYWLRQYKLPKEESERQRIIETINYKFENDILSLGDAIKVTLDSKDSEKEKQRILKIIKDPNTPIRDNYEEREDDEDE